jgi:rubrerythrin
MFWRMRTRHSTLKENGMDTYITVRDVLDKAQDVHRQMKDLYAQLAERCVRNQPEILLKYLKSKEEEYEQGLAQNIRNDRNGLLDTWMQYAPDLSQFAIPSPDAFEKEITLKEIEATAQRIRESLINFYETAAHTAKPDTVRQLFEKLAEQHQSEKAAVKTTLNSLKHNE